MNLRVIIAQVLNNHLRKAEAAHKRLTSAKCRLEHNISVKITSINIDANLLMNREVNKKCIDPIRLNLYSAWASLKKNVNNSISFDCILVDP